MRVPDKKYVDNLSRFRNEVMDLTGIKKKKKGFNAPVTRKEKRKISRKLKHAKNLAFSKKEKAPTLDAFMISSKKLKKPKKQNDTEEDKMDTAQHVKNKPTKKTKEPKQESKPQSAKELIESRIIKEKSKEKNYEKSTKSTLKQKLLEDNEREEKEIKRLEKMLHIKKTSKKMKQNFLDDGLGDLLDFCDEEKRDEISKIESNAWTEKNPEPLEVNDFFLSKRADKIKKANAQLAEESDDENQPMSDDDIDEDEMEGSDDDLDEDETEGSDGEGSEGSDDESDLNENDESNSYGDASDDDGDVNSKDEDDEDEDDEDEDDEDEERIVKTKEEIEDEKLALKLKKKGIKEDIYGRLVDKKGSIVKSEKYIPPAQRLQKLLSASTPESTLRLQKLSKQLNGLLNRLSTANMHSICNQIIQMFYSNQFTRHELIETLYTLLNNGLINTINLSPIRLIVEHAALVVILSANIGIELGANLLQKYCMKINENLGENKFLDVANKSLDNLILLLCNFYNFKLFSSNLILDLLNDKLVEMIKYEEDSDANCLEKIIDLILLVFRCVGFSLRKDNPVLLKDLIAKLHSRINSVKAKMELNNNSGLDMEMNNRLKFMLESLTAIKNNDIRRLDAFDQQPIEAIKKQAKILFKEEKDHVSQLNISFKDLINANELGRWWIVGSAWSLKENENNEGNLTKNQMEEVNSTQASGGFSEKILKIAKQQHMNTDIRRAIFCIIISAEDYTDAFMKLVKLSLKKQQEREIIYVIMHCSLNEKKYNPYYSFLMQKFCEYDRRFKMTLQFHTWDKFKLLMSFTKQQVTNLANLLSHIIASDCMSLSILKNAEFGEMNKSMLQFLRELLTNLMTKQLPERLQDIFMRISSIKALSQLRNALKLFISHFMLTDKGQDIEIDEKLKSKCLLIQKYLSLNEDD